MAYRLRTIAAMSVALVALLAGCSKKDAVEQAQPAATKGPSVAEVKAIAEEGFIYGLPLVMNYAVMYEFVLDKNSGQYKGPFNHARTTRPGCSPTRTPPSSRRTATRRTRCCGWTCAPSRS